METINVYIYDIRENIPLHRNEWIVSRGRQRPGN